MGLFNRKSRSKFDPETAIVEVVPNNTEDKKAFTEAAKQAKEINQKFNDQLLANGFTIKIYIAAGGKKKGRSNT